MLTREEICRQRFTKHGHCKKGKATREYHSWAMMNARCFYQKSNRYQYYGARGITVCEQWRNFENFLADMGPRPEKTSLDRIDIDGNYEPSNCRWATTKQQSASNRGNFKKGQTPWNKGRSCH